MQFKITSEEGLPIRGDLEVPERARALVFLVHGFKGFKDWSFFPWMAQRFVAHRIAVCRFNMSRSGIGDDPESFDRLDLLANDTYSIEISDLRTVVANVQQRLSHLPAFVLGHSRGGAIALLTARDVPNLHGVVTWSSISRCDRWDDDTKRQWRARGYMDVVNVRTRQVMRMSPAVLDDCERNRERLDVVHAVDELNVPLLVLHGGRDDSVPVDEARAIASRVPDTSLLVIGSATHTFNAIHPLIHVPFELALATETSARFITAHA